MFGGNSHNGTLGAQSNQPCFATDFVAYDIGTCTLNNNEQITLTEGPNARDQIAFCTFHSFLVEGRMNAGYIDATHT